MSVTKNLIGRWIYKRQNRYIGLTLFALFFLFYAYTLAPTFLWSDPSKLASISYIRGYSLYHSNHALHTFLGSLLYLLPLSFLEIVYLQNLLCAIYGALALLIIYYTLKRLGFNSLPSIFTVALLGISQMFWLTSVIFESYALLSLTNALWIYFLIRWSQEKDNLLYLYLLTLAIFLGFLNHYITLLYVPFIAIFTIYNAKKRLKITMYWCGLLLLISFLILIFCRKFITTFINDITFTARYFGSLNNFSKHFLKNIAIYPGYLFYQFPFFGFFLGIYGIFVFPKRRNKVFSLLLILLVLSILFWTYHGAGRHPFIHNPVYMFFSFFICIGLERFYHLDKKKMLWLLIFFLAITPVIYYFTPRILTAWGIDIRRNIPYRNANIYYLWPSKRGYYGAQRFAEQALNRVNHSGILVADFTMAAPLHYLQVAGRYRQDVFVFLPEYISAQGSVPGEILWPRWCRFLDDNISLRGCVYVADKHSVMFVVTHREGRPITSWDLINERYKVDWVWPVYKISPIKKE